MTLSSSTLSYYEFCEVLSELESCHAVFASLWSSIRPIFSDEVPTAGIGFDKERKVIKFIINKEFWDKQDLTSKAFILAHESLHIILNHGPRSKNIDPSLFAIANIAMDLAVNHKLVNNFNFDRSKINNQENYCWVDTVFSHPVADDLSFETYFNMLKEDSSATIKQLVDAHAGLDNISDDDLSNLAKEIVDSCSNKELNTFYENIKHELNTGMVGEPLIPSSIKTKLTFDSIKHKAKWESIIKKWQDYVLVENDEYQWVTEDRRFASMNDTADALFPQNGITENKDYEKISVMFFLDTSGSCFRLADRFFKAALSLNPKRFNVRLFGRSTEVIEIQKNDIKNINFTLGGSDDFSCIERFIQKELATKKIPHYPHAVFHITDGHDCSGIMVNPMIPKNWFWFLTEGGISGWIPAGCNIFHLKDFE